MMKIILVGGPYDGEVFNAILDIKGEPIPFLNLIQKESVAVRPVDFDLTPPTLAASFVRYRLEQVADKEWKDGCWQYSEDKWHWEYHFYGDK